MCKDYCKFVTSSYTLGVCELVEWLRRLFYNVLCQIICYGKVPPEEQIKELLRKKLFKEAIFLVEELHCEGEITNEMVSFVHAQVGFLLLFDLHFKEAVDHFLLSEHMHPSEVFPFIMGDPNRWSLLVCVTSFVLIGFTCSSSKLVCKGAFGVDYILFFGLLTCLLVVLNTTLVIILY